MSTSSFVPFDLTRPLQIVSPIEEWCGTDEASMRAGFQNLIDMGVSGFVTNVKLEHYLKDEASWDVLRKGVALAHEMGLRVWIYDEKGYPSGAAGGLVLERYPAGEAEGLIEGYDNDGQPKFEVATMFENTHATANFFERRHYINVLDQKAVATFIDVTHEAYEKALHPIGENVEAFFTDEPSLIAAYVPAGLDYPKTIPWHPHLAETFRGRKGYDITRHWASLFEDTGGIDKKVRCDFYEVIADLCAETYFGQLQSWCQTHKTMSSGHLLGEETLVWQTLFDGDPFACYRKFDMPGIDMILSSPERIMQDREPFFLVPKVASSAARLQGKRRVMCEISDFFGMMGGRHAPLDQMKCTAAVLMSLGITDFTSYYSVPLKSGEQADPTPKSRRFSVAEYRQYTDYVSRVNTVLAEGIYKPRTAVLYPIVSVWANFTPPTRSMYEPHPSDRVRFIDESFANLCRELLQHQIEYDIIDERGLQSGEVRGKKLIIGDNEYDALVLPPIDTIRTLSLEMVARLTDQGGAVFAHALNPKFAAEGEDKDKDIVRMMKRIQSKGGFALAEQPTTPIHYLIRSRVPPVAHLTPSSPHVLCRSVWKNGLPTILLTNASSKSYRGNCALHTADEISIIDMETGAEEKSTPKKTGSSLQFDLNIVPFGSVFLKAGS
jgi:hypothetical protein